MDAARTIMTDATDATPEVPGGVTSKATDDVGRVTPMMEQYIGSCAQR